LFSRYCIGTVPAPSSTKTTRLLKEHTSKNKDADKKTVDQQIIEMLWTIRKPPNEETTFGQLVAHEMAQIKDVVTKLLRKRSRWRKNPVLSPSRARKLARSRLPQPRPPNPPRNPCFFRPTIPGLRAEQSSPTATAASQRPRAATEPTKGPRRACRAHSHSDPNSDHPPDSPSTSSEPAPDTTSDSAYDPRLPARSLP
jgi:hypothetical protein